MILLIVAPDAGDEEASPFTVLDPLRGREAGLAPIAHVGGAVEGRSDVVQVSVGENKRQGVLVTSRCLWNTSTDNYVSVSYKNDQIWANAIIFGCYTQ